MADIYDKNATTCHWCFQEEPVQTIPQELWDFWKVISTEDQNLVPYKNICGSCKLRYEEFSVYVENWKTHASSTEKVLLGMTIKTEPVADFEDENVCQEAVSDSDCPTGSKDTGKTELELRVVLERWQSATAVIHDKNAITCHWCFQEEPVQTIPQELWDFWKVISTEDQNLVPYKNICGSCKLRYEEFSVYVENWKTHASSTEKVLLGRTIKTEPLIDIEDHIINESVCQEAVSDSDYPTDSKDVGKTGLVLRVVLERAVLADSMIFRKKRNTTHICSFCNKTFDYHSTMKNHIRIHTGEKPFKCSQCEKCFSTSSYLNQHIRLHTGEKAFKCLQCKKCFNAFSHLNRHIRIHTGEKPFKCSQCDKCFSASSDLSQHLRIHTGEKPFKCSQCDKCFSISSNLKKHLRIHTLEKPFKCSQCDKYFNLSFNLKKHLLIHTGEKPFKCSQCDKCFSASSHLNQHKRIHTGEKPFKCSQCDKRFNTSSNLNQHKRIHTSEKPFKCSQCDKCFSVSSNLKKHLRIHTGEKPFKCSQCDKCFSNSSHLKRHIHVHTR